MCVCGTPACVAFAGGVICFPHPPSPGSLRRLPSCEGGLGSPRAWGSVRLVSLQLLHVISFFTAVKQLKPWGFVRCHPPPSLTHLPPLPRYGPPRRDLSGC